MELAEKEIREHPGARAGILCKTNDETKLLYLWLRRQGKDLLNLHLLNSGSAKFYDGVMVSSVALSKGLEFDAVIVPGADSKNYCSECDRGLLYVACTRAIHRLTVLYSGSPTSFLPHQQVK